MTGTAIGIDLGSRATKLVWVEREQVVRSELFDTGHDSMSRVMELLEGSQGTPVSATGYGRNLVNISLSCPTITEIRACARGAHHLCPECTGVIDIGGQDSKVIELNDSGKAVRFEMNDRCAAGTGRFLEVMARALGYSLEAFADEALAATAPVHINSMCTVFAESEVVSLIAQGTDRSGVALGLHLAVARRIAALTSRVSLGSKPLFVGGVANNLCMVKTLAEELDVQLLVPEQPEFVVALGAAWTALETNSEKMRDRNSPTGSADRVRHRHSPTGGSDA